MERAEAWASDTLNRLVVANIAEFVALVDAEGIVLFASPAYELKLGYAVEELLGRPLMQFVHQDEREHVEMAFAACAAEQPVPLGVFRLRHRDGGWIELEGDIALIDTGEAELRLLTAHGVDERVRLVRAEYEFVANAAHELLTPLAAMNAAIDVLQSGAKEVPAERDIFLADLEREVDRLVRLAQALLVLARVQATGEAPSLYPVELGPLVHEVAEGLQAGADVAVDVVCGEEIVVLAERDLLERALTNLAQNAAAHTVRGGIVFAIRSQPQGRVVIEVRDTGCGMPSDEQARAFDRFYRADARTRAGFGLGLAIVREVMRVLDGSVEIQSEPGVGTTVRLTLAAA